MIKNKKILAIITARGGSKSIPKKNIIPVNGKPLIYYVIQAARKSKLLDEAIVSTDSPEIKKTSLRFGIKVPFLRPKNLATDKSKSIDALIHGLNFMENRNKTRYDYVMCLQPTNPFVSGADIDEAIKLIINKKTDSLTSVYKLTDFHPAKLKVISQGLLKDFQVKEAKGTRRQDYPDIYKRNGGIYLIKRETALKGLLFGKTTAPYIMPPEKSVDINDYFDLEFVKVLLKKLNISK